MRPGSSPNTTLRALGQHNGPEAVPAGFFAAMLSGGEIDLRAAAPYRYHLIPYLDRVPHPSSVPPSENVKLGVVPPIVHTAFRFSESTSETLTFAVSAMPG